MGGLHIQRRPEALVFTGQRVGRTGIGLDVRQLLPEHFVFRLQRLIAEHIAVVLLGRIPQRADAGTEGRQHGLHDHIGNGQARQVADDGQRQRQRHRNDQHHPHFRRKEMSH